MPGLYFGDDSNRKDVANPFVNDVSSKNDSKAGEPAPVSQSPIPSSSRNLKHASNRDDLSDGFKNDFSSRATAEARRLQEALDLEAKLAAEDAAKAAAKKAEEEAQEFKRLRDLKTTHEVQITDLTKQLEKATSDVADLQSTKTRLEVDNTDLNGKLDSEKEESKRARQEAKGYYSTINDQMMQLQAKRALDVNNNLDPACHGRQAYIVHLRSRTAVDLGAGNGTYCHGWGFDITNGNQKVLLHKVDPDNRFSYWTVMVDNRYMEFLSDGNGHIPRCYSRRSGGIHPRMQEWVIGRVGTGGYVLQNAYFGTALDIENIDECKNGQVSPKMNYTICSNLDIQETTSFVGEE